MTAEFPLTITTASVDGTLIDWLRQLTRQALLAPVVDRATLLELVEVHSVPVMVSVASPE
jgi:hypothetical protein